MTWTHMNTQYAHFRGNPLCQATKATDSHKQLKVIKNERNLRIIYNINIYPCHNKKACLKIDKKLFVLGSCSRK